MADRPIIFSAPMVRALLDGRKTQTRRVLKTQPDPAFPIGGAEFVAGIPGSWCWLNGFDGSIVHQIETPPRYGPGDRLWVRETWAVGNIYDGVAPRDINPGGKPGWCGIRYAATDVRKGIFDRSPIHMPRWASRLTLLVTDVRVQRLQEISEADALAEGATRLHDGAGEVWHSYGSSEATASGSPIYAFQGLWDSIHGLESWAQNPWVVAVSFDVHRCNIDQMEAADG